MTFRNSTSYPSLRKKKLSLSTAKYFSLFSVLLNFLISLKSLTQPIKKNIKAKKVKAKKKKIKKSSSLEISASFNTTTLKQSSPIRSNFKRKLSSENYLMVGSELDLNKLCLYCKSPWKEPVLVKKCLSVVCKSCLKSWRTFNSKESDLDSSLFDEEVIHLNF